jgi:4-hydroxy-tetrahydrodipicolinate synthase
MIDLKGTGVALVTPMSSKGKVDFQALEKLVNHVCKGVDYLVALGTTGESATLNKAEKKEVLKTIHSSAGGQKPIVLGLGGNDTEELIRQFDEWDWSGIEAVLSVSPYYNKPSQEGLIQHYSYFSDHCPKPVILYNVPGRTGSNISAETTLTLAHHPNIIGTKEASGNVEQCMSIAAKKPSDFILLSGDDLLTPSLISIGAEGVISVLANAWPVEFSKMVRLCLASDFKTAGNIWKNWISLNPLLYEEGNPVGIKALMSCLKICGEEVRLPLLKASDGLIDKIKTALEAISVQ